MFVGIVNRPDPGARSDIKHTFDLGVEIIWRRQAQSVIESQNEQVMLKV